MFHSSRFRGGISQDSSESSKKCGKLIGGRSSGLNKLDRRRREVDNCKFRI